MMMRTRTEIVALALMIMGLICGGGIIPDQPG